MVFRTSADDEPFFREWRERRGGEPRSLVRARRLAAILGVDDVRTPVLTVVGSKGKGTAALFASATLAASGLRVGTLTSPSIVTNRERIRIDGAAIASDEYRSLSQALDAALRELGPRSDSGYLSPTGLYTLMGVRCVQRHGCDVLVLEAGIGGRSDEVSLFVPLVVGVTPVFGEHVGLLGRSVVEIAENKCGVIQPGTRAVLSARQQREIAAVLEAHTARRGARLSVLADERGFPEDSPESPRQLSIANARLGIAAASAMLELLGHRAPDAATLESALATVRTPGRLSLHSDAAQRPWLVDACIDRAGARAALEFADLHFGHVPNVFVCIPESKDVAGVRHALDGRDYTPVRVETEHLRFEPASWDRPMVDVSDVERRLVPGPALALGTWSFIDRTLGRLGVDCEVLFRAGRVPPGSEIRTRP